MTEANVTIRRATEDDLPAVLAISNHAAMNTIANFAVEPEPLDHWQESFAKTQRMYPWLVAVDSASHAVAGFAKASPWKGRCAYDYSTEVTVYIDERFRGCGIGTKLYKKLFAILERQGYCSLLAGIAQPNPASVKLHESLGMKRAALFERIGWKFDAWHDVGYWQLSFGSADTPPSKIRPVGEVWSN